MSLQLAHYIDHTILKQTATTMDVEWICSEAKVEGFVAVCIPPKYVADGRRFLAGTKVKLATVIGFPFGYNTIRTKVTELLEALEAGADEIDMVIDVAAVKNGDWRHLEDEIMACVRPVKDEGKVIKLIVESGILTDEELLACCRLYSNYDIDFMKTSTGYAEKGASVHAVQLMRANLPSEMGIKASGGIRTYAFAKELIDAGATRIGCSAGIEIMKEFRIAHAE